MPSSAPQRTCIACKKSGEQCGFVRIAGRTLSVTTGPSNGRSAYVCRQAECLGAAFAKGRLSRALRQSLDHDQLERLRRELDAIPI